MREVQWMQWFAEAGPADEAARTGDTAPDAGEQEAFSALIRGQYKEQFDARVQKILDGRLRGLRQENARLQDKISQIRLVSRAKCCLVEHAHLTEAEAHRRIEKLAMDTRRDRTEIAQEILDSYEDVGV